MAAFIAFIASLNLCIGYALGVYIGVMPGVSPRRRDDVDDEEPIALTPVAASTQQTVPEPVVSEAATSDAAESEVDEQQPADDEADSAKDSDTTDEQNHTYILEGLSAFKSKLDTVSAKLAETTDDREAIDECAGELKQANSEYLEKATEALDTLGEENVETASDEQRQLQESLAQQSADVRQANEDIDEILADEDSSAVREKLLESTDQLASAATKVEESVPDSDKKDKPVAEAASPEAEEPEEQPIEEPDPEMPGVGKIDELLDAIGSHLDDESNKSPIQVAALCLKAGGDSNAEHIKHLLNGLEQVVMQELTDGQTLAVDEHGRLFLALSDDDEAAATERCERIRQQLAKTNFRRNGEVMAAEVLCAFADSKAVRSPDDVIRRLDNSLDEAAKLTESRTFHHDGTVAIPVKPMDVMVDPIDVEI